MCDVDRWLVVEFQLYILWSLVRSPVVEIMAYTADETLFVEKAAQYFVCFTECLPDFLVIIIQYIWFVRELFIGNFIFLRIKANFFAQIMRSRSLDIGQAVRVFANGPGDLGSILGRVIPKTQKMVLDASLLNTQHYKVWIKGKVELSRESSSTLPYTFV